MTGPRDVHRLLSRAGYVSDSALDAAVFFALELKHPLLLEGEAGAGKTEVARALAQATGARLIRLQCHEGLDRHQALYDWDYARQLLSIRAADSAPDGAELFSRRFLRRRPLLEALEQPDRAVLLIDEVDRADDEFDALLLEFLADFAITIPELGTITARHEPLVVLTSNRTRELHDALKRRCLYHWLDYPDEQREMGIMRSRVPGVADAVAARVRAAVEGLGDRDPRAVLGTAETMVWARALLASEAPPPGTSEVPAVSTRLARLARAMRRRGVRIGVAEVLVAHRALAAVDASSREEAFLALRATLCSSMAHLEVFAEAFDAVFGAAGDGATTTEDEDLLTQAPPPQAGLPDEEGEGSRELDDPVPAAWSDVELLRMKDFADYSEDERAAARRMLARLAARGPQRRSRRTRPTLRRGHIHDVRETLRRSLRYWGEPIDRRYRRYAKRPRRVVLVCDVSGSMAPYSRMLMQYVQASVAARKRVEAFAFGTRLTRVTLDLKGKDVDAALQRAVGHVLDWAGGTRIGASLAELNREHGRRIGRGAVIVVLSDGWDRGDPDELAAEMARLRRCAHRVLWLNPHAADPRFEPLTRGMCAALPNVDRLLAGNSIASLEVLADVLEEAW